MKTPRNVTGDKLFVDTAMAETPRQSCGIEDQPKEMTVETCKALIIRIVEQLRKPAKKCAIWISDDERYPQRQSYTAADLLTEMDELQDHNDFVMCDGEYNDPVVRIGQYRRGVIIVIDSMLSSPMEE